MNKPQTLLHAAPHIQTTHGLWLDGDTIIVAALDAFLEQPERRFLACVEELGPVSDGPGHPFDSFWLAIGKSLGMGASEIPWVTSRAEGRPVHLPRTSSTITA